MLWKNSVFISTVLSLNAFSQSVTPAETKIISDFKACAATRYSQVASDLKCKLQQNLVKPFRDIRQDCKFESVDLKSVSSAEQLQYLMVTIKSLDEQSESLFESAINAQAKKCGLEGKYFRIEEDGRHVWTHILPEPEQFPSTETSSQSSH